MSIAGEDLYREVNLLPAWYQQALHRRTAARRQFTLLGVMLLVMAMLIAQTCRSRAAVQAYRDSVVDQLASSRRQVTEVQKLEKARVDLARQLRIHRELHQPLSYSHVAGTLASLMPESVAVKAVQMRSEKLTTTRPMNASEAAAHKARTGKGPDKAFISESHPVIQMELDGIAPSDVEVANFIGALAGSRLFQNVKMLYSKQGTSKVRDAQLVTREFRIRMDVPLNCEYKPMPAEVARAR